MTGILQRREGDEGKRDYLDGRGLHCGDELLLQVFGQRGAVLLIPVRYEVDHMRRHASGGPMGYLIASGAPGNGTSPSVCIDLNEQTPVKWPASARRSA
jgi:hypothetical protein